MKVVFAPEHLQAILHVEETSGRRLAKYLDLLKEVGIEATFPDSGNLESELSNATIIVASTGTSDLRDSTVELLAAAVRNGKSLLHLSNHSPFPSYDRPLAEKLGYVFKDMSFVDGKYKPPFEFGFNLGALPNSGSDRMAEMVVSVNNCSSLEIRDERFRPLSVLPETCVSVPGDGECIGEIFAIACERFEKTGRICAIADSGLIGEPISDFPGPGLEAGDNYTILTEVTKWLAGSQ